MTARTRSEIAAYALAVAALALLALRSWWIDYDYSIDFQTYWLAGARVLHGRAADLYAPGGGPGEGTPIAMGPNEFKNVPLVAAAFAPLAAFDYATAKRVAWWGGLVAIVAAAWLVGRHVLPEGAGPPAVRVALALAALAVMAPTHTALRHGQTTPAVALLLAVHLAATARGRPVAAGIALGLACLVKFPPLALLGLDAARGRTRAAAACLATIAGAFVLSVALFGPRLHIAYERGIAEQAGRVMAAHNNQSIVAAASRVLDAAPGKDWTPRPPGLATRIASDALAVVLVAVTAWALFRRGRETSAAGSEAAFAFEATAVLVVGIVVLPVAWDHYVLMAAPALVATAAWLRAVPAGPRGALIPWMATAFLLLAVPTPTRLIEGVDASSALAGLALSHYFFGWLVLFGVAVAARSAGAREGAAA